MDTLAEIDLRIAETLAINLFAGLLRHIPIPALTRGVTAGEIAEHMGTPVATAALLASYSARYSGWLIESGDGAFRLNDALAGSDSARFRLMKYLGAYELALRHAWASAADAEQSTDMRLLAAAYRELAGRPMVWLPKQLEQLGLRSLLEVGCGSAPVLRSAAQANWRVRGVAADPSPEMLNLARERIAAQGLGERIRLEQCDLEGIATGERIFAKAFDGIVLRNVLNEYFRDGHEKVVGLLAALSRNYPAARIVVSDYFGGLGTNGGECQTLTHDLVQVVSGQGIPPDSHQEWDEIYAKAGLRLTARAIDRSTQGITQFMDVVARPALEMPE